MTAGPVSADPPVPGSLTMVCTVLSPEMKAAFEEVYAAAGYQLNIHLVPPARATVLVENGSASDMAVAANTIETLFTTDVVRIGIGGRPIGTLPLVCWVRAGEEAFWTVSHLSQARIGYVLGSPTSTQAAKAFLCKAIVQAPSYETAARMLSGGRFDLIFAPQGVGEPFFDLDTFGCFAAPLPPAEYWHILPASWKGTEKERRLRAAFLLKGDQVLKAFQEIAVRVRPPHSVIWN
jgi:hypothetical protein